MSKSPTSEFQSSVGVVMIRVPAGSFTMGSPESEDGHRAWEQQREVTFANDFYLGKSPVTQDEFEAVTGTNPTDHVKILDAPVDSVTWDQANGYCQKLTKLDREAGVLPDDWEYRLPTEAEWEYACRAGGTEPRHGEPQDVAWHHDNADEKPHAVGQKTPNPWGFHDMLGNVWEWCQDWFYVASRRSVRGGSYFNSARFCRSAQRWGWNPNGRGRYCGFRLLAAATSSFDLSPPINDFPTQERPPSIYDAIDANDFDLALRVITADPAAIESVDGIPPPLHACIYHDKPEMLEWLLDHGADIERREQDYGSTPLRTAVVMRQKRVIPILVGRGAKTEGALKRARNGLAGAYEDFGLDRKGYQEIVELLQTLGVEE
jgi:Sulfatase-modifying factor enzyme 1/Ankyrin repeats (many copies)